MPERGMLTQVETHATAMVEGLIPKRNVGRNNFCTVAKQLWSVQKAIETNG